MQNALNHFVPKKVKQVAGLYNELADHTGKDKQSHLLKHALTRNHRHLDLSYMKIIDSSFHTDNLKRKISKALYMKQYRLSLNFLEQSVKLRLFK